MITAVVVMAKTSPGTQVATEHQLRFRRGRHLAFAILGLVHAPASGGTGAALVWLMGASEWNAELSTLNRVVQLVLVAFVAWLAFVGFDTRSGVTVLPKRWRDLGLTIVIVCVGVELYSMAAVCRFPAEHFTAIHAHLFAFSQDGDIRWGWLIAALLASALAEELVYRVLLLRALEGYARPLVALSVQAAVFELVHAYVYGYGLSGVWFVAGLVLGGAFQRTRSLAVPAMLHAAHNTVFFALVWHLNR